MALKFQTRHQSVLFRAHHVRPDTLDPFLILKRASSPAGNPDLPNSSAMFSHTCCVRATSGNPRTPQETPGNPRKPSETRGIQDWKPRAHGRHRERENIWFWAHMVEAIDTHTHENQCAPASLLSDQVLPPGPFFSSLFGF